MDRIVITEFNAVCNLGGSIDEIYSRAISGDCSHFDLIDIEGKLFRVAKVKTNLSEIVSQDFNIRTNQLILKALEKINVKKLIEKYGQKQIAVVASTTNSGVEEFETTNNIKQVVIGNSAEFVRNYYGLKNYYTSVSTACSSGIKAFQIARELLKSGFAQAVLIVSGDALTKVPLFGFDSLGILSQKQSVSFSKNREGINIGEGAAVFILEKNQQGIEILGIGETTDVYHSTTPDPNGIEARRAIELALSDAKINSDEIDYINLHGTGTIANDEMESKAVYGVFNDSVPASSLKPMIGHLLGASASVEVAISCKLFGEKLIFPHVYDGIYDEILPKINLAKQNYTSKTVKTILKTSFGFGGTNCAIVLRKD